MTSTGRRSRDGRREEPPSPPPRPASLCEAGSRRWSVRGGSGLREGPRYSGAPNTGRLDGSARPPAAGRSRGGGHVSPTVPPGDPGRGAGWPPQRVAALGPPGQLSEGPASPGPAPPSSLRCVPREGPAFPFLGRSGRKLKGARGGFSASALAARC